jgi:hypothetical protein
MAAALAELSCHSKTHRSALRLLLLLRGWAGLTLSRYAQNPWVGFCVFLSCRTYPQVLALLALLTGSAALTAVANFSQCRHSSI